MTILHSIDDDLLTPREVAALFRVDPKTVARWAKTGQLAATRTLGGHRRFHRGTVMALRQMRLEGGEGSQS